MIKVEIEPNDVEDPADDTYGYVLRVRDGQNGEVLLSSTSQGYTNPSFAQELARRIFAKGSPLGPDDGSGSGTAFVVDYDEHVTMVTTYRDGSTNTEGLR